MLGSPGSLDEDTIVDLEETEELQDFSGFGCDFVDTKMGSGRKDLDRGDDRRTREFE